jgi:hypothetical protein
MWWFRGWDFNDGIILFCVMLAVGLVIIFDMVDILLILMYVYGWGYIMLYYVDFIYMW